MVATPPVLLPAPTSAPRSAYSSRLLSTEVVGVPGQMAYEVDQTYEQVDQDVTALKQGVEICFVMVAVAVVIDVYVAEWVAVAVT